MSQKVVETKVLNILCEVHPNRCGCSYCVGASRLHIGLNLPKDKGRTSWRVIKLGRLYIRWTSPYVAISKRVEVGKFSEAEKQGGKPVGEEAKPCCFKDGCGYVRLHGYCLGVTCSTYTPM